MPSTTYVRLADQDEPKDGHDLPWKQRGTEYTPNARTMIILLGILVFALSTALILLLLRQEPNSSDRYQSHGFEKAHGIVPPFPTIMKEFHKDDAFESNSVAADDLWDRLLPVGQGYIRVPNPRTHNLHPSRKIENDTENSEMYAVSVSHQLHCLAILRHVLVAYELDRMSPLMQSHHTHHCFNYLKQALMCNADMTLEWSTLQESEGVPAAHAFTGHGIPHQCKDWDAIRDFMVENRASDSEHLLIA